MVPTQPYPTWRDNDLVATELEQWLLYLNLNDDGYRKIRYLLGDRIATLRSAQELEQIHIGRLD